jgi:diguanylate cyclase (GGDEF)-like protein/PAS domain S-box-containing protein
MPSVTTPHRITERADLVFAQLPVAAALVDNDGRVVDVNTCCARTIGWGPEDHGTELLRLVSVHHEDLEPLRGALAGFGAAATGQVTVHRGGELLNASVSVSPLHDEGDRVGALVLVHPDVPDPIATGAGSFKTLVQEASDLIVVSDEEGSVRYVSPAMERILGFEPGEVMGWNPLEFLNADDSGHVVAAIAGTLGLPGPDGPVQCRARHRDGSWRWLEIIVTNLLEDPDVQGIVLNARDITERKELEEQLERRALHDALTGLPNRALLHDRIVHALERLERDPGLGAAVLLLDLDDFKRVNDTLGHDAGDRVLVATARRLRAVVRPHDTVARLGGDEFVVVCQDLDAEGAAAVAERIAGAFAEPFHLGASALRVRASIGTAIAEQGDDADELLRRADLSMYQTKAVTRRDI